MGWDTYPKFIEPRITRVPLGFSGYIWLNTKILLNFFSKYIFIFVSQVTEKPAGVAGCPSNVIPENGYIDDKTVC